jgi:gliding motility-associated-like protein
MKSYIIFLFLVISSRICANNPDVKTVQNFNQSIKWAFEENKGQVTGQDSAKVKFFHKQGNLTMFLLNTGIAYQFEKRHYPEGYKPLDKFASQEEIEIHNELSDSIRVETYRMDLELIGANPNTVIIKEGESSDYIQYYNQNVLGVRSYQKITYKNVYPNIDWVVYKTDTGIKYDFIVHPGGYPEQIQIKTKWVENTQIDMDGNLALENRMGTIVEHKPISYQGDRTIKTEFKNKNGIISFFLDQYDSSQSFIIDPLIRLWGTYYGGNGTEQVGSCILDSLGNIYLTGSTSSSLFIASGGYQNSNKGFNDAFLVKFNSNGVRQWASYYGDSFNDIGSSCAVDRQGNIFLAGYTEASTLLSFGGHQNTYGGGFHDAFLVKFNSNGVRQWATYYGGNGTDYGSHCMVDSIGNVYMVGETESDSSIAFGGHQNTYAGNYDAFLVKFNSNGVRQWATYYGGSDNSDRGLSGTIDYLGNIFMVGTTASTSSIAFGGHQNIHGGGSLAILDAFLVKFNSNGVRQWATYYGDSLNNWGNACAVDYLGNVYLTGMTEASSSIAVSGHQNTFGGGWVDAFLVKFNLNGIRQWATFYGDSFNDEANSCIVDNFGNVYIAGATGSDSFIAKDGYQNIFGKGWSDAFLVKFNSNGIRQWATYYGDSSEDYGHSCAVNKLGNIYMAGYTNSSRAITQNGHQNAIGGEHDAFLVKFQENFCSSTISVIYDSICEGDSIFFKSVWRRNAAIYRDTLTNSVGCDSFINLFLYIKNKTYSIQNIKRCFNDPYFFNGQNLIKDGTYYDTLTNSKNCDSIIQLNLTIIPSLIRPDFDTSMKLCYSYTSPLLNNLSSNGIIGVWNPSTIDNTKTSSYVFTPDANQCATSITLFVEILPLPSLKLDYILNDTICIGDSVKISILEESNYNYKWSSGESTSYKIASPYENSSYFVTITNSYGCNQIETAKIYVRSLQAKISGPNRVNKGDNVQLNVISNLPVKDYNWLPKEYFKEQKGEQAYIKIEESLTVELNAKDSFGCQALDIFPIRLIGKDILVPTGFSPNKDGVNDYFLPIVKDNVKILAFRVYNRWGEMVYNYDSKYKIGWDGKFNEDDCSAGVYNYQIEYSIESKSYKTNGEITLIR